MEVEQHHLQQLVKRFRDFGVTKVKDPVKLHHVKQGGFDVLLRVERSIEARENLWRLHYRSEHDDVRLKSLTTGRTDSGIDGALWAQNLL